MEDNFTIFKCTNGFKNCLSHLRSDVDFKFTTKKSIICQQTKLSKLFWELNVHWNLYVIGLKWEKMALMIQLDFMLKFC